MPDENGQMQQVPIGTGVSNGNYVGLTRDAFIISRKSIRY